MLIYFTEIRVLNPTMNQPPVTYHKWLVKIILGRPPGTGSEDGSVCNRGACLDKWPLLKPTGLGMGSKKNMGHLESSVDPKQPVLSWCIYNIN